MSVSPLPTPVPQTSDPVNFNPRADALMTALPTFVTEVNALQVDVNAKQVLAATSATNAATSETNAAASAGSAYSSSNVTGWVSGTTYAQGVCVYSLLNFQTYRRRGAGAGTTDPAQDTTNWQVISNYLGTAVFTSNGTFTPDPSAKFYLIDLVGGGQSGGVSSNTSVGAYGSGGGGGERRTIIVPASYLTEVSYSIVVGQGGASITLVSGAGAAAQFVGNPGGNTVFGSGVASIASKFTAYGGGRNMSGTNNAQGGNRTTTVSGGGEGNLYGLHPTNAGIVPQDYCGGRGGEGATYYRGGCSAWGGAGGAGGSAGTNSSPRLTDSTGGASGVYMDGTLDNTAYGGGLAGVVGSPLGKPGANATNNSMSGGGGGSAYIPATGGDNGTYTSGDGGFPGGGGGGVGAWNYNNATLKSGKGGNGICRIYWW